MARSFTAASSEYLEVDTGIISAYPFTLATWFNSDDLTVGQSLMFIGDKDVSDYFSTLQASGNVAGDPVRALSGRYGAATFQNAATSTGYSANTWHHACAVFATAASRAAYIDGGSKVTDANSVGPISAHDRTIIGRNGDSTPGAYMSGLIAEAAVWNVALTDAEVAALALGFAPPFIRPDALVFYMPLVRDDDNDLVGGLSLTAFNSPTIGSHTRLFGPAMSTVCPVRVKDNAPFFGANF